MEQKVKQQRRKVHRLLKIRKQTDAIEFVSSTSEEEYHRKRMQFMLNTNMR